MALDGTLRAGSASSWCCSIRRSTSGLAAGAAAAAARLVTPGGFVYVEAPAPLDEPPAGLALHRSLRAGAVSAQLFVSPA